MIPKRFFMSSKLRSLLEEDNTADCEACGSDRSLHLNPAYKYTLPGSNETIILPAWECSICKEFFMEQAGLLKIAEHLKKPYEQVQMENFVLTKKVIH